MPEQKYNTTWVSQNEIMPSGLCKKCKIGELKQSQFFDGMYCPNCKWQWRRSKFPPKVMEVQKSGEKEFHEEPLLPEQGWQIEIIGRLDKIEEHLKNLRKGQEILERKITGRE